MTLRPHSAAVAFTGLAGVVSATVTAFAIHGWEAPSHTKTLVVALVAVAVMISTECLFGAPGQVRLWERKPLRAGSVSRTVQKLFGFWCVIGVLAAAYAILPEYASDYYHHIRDAFLEILPLLVVASPFYIYFVDRRQDDPADHYLLIAAAVRGDPVPPLGEWKDFALGWVVKGFFLPLMFTFLTLDLQGYWSQAQLPSFDTFVRFYEFAYGYLFLCDVLLAVVGYSLTLRLFDAHIRTVEPTVLGWVSCLMCYPPFWQHLSGRYFGYENDNYYWGDIFWGMPALYVLWGSAILSTLFVYVWATGAFGLRFSNLTHRGIITDGPYRWTKHPAYLAKNLSYWMISLPFITTGTWLTAVQGCVLLAGVNLIYLVRAITEERHLARDPVYREYQVYIAEHGALARLRRLVGVPSRI